jgi:hypothetical protein
MIKSLEYYYADGSREQFDKYTIDTSGVIRNATTGGVVSTYKSGKYNAVSVRNSIGKRRNIPVGRSVASTFHGKPTTLKHTVDHIDRDPNNDMLENIRWLCKTGQNYNQNRLGTNKNAFVIVRDEVEKTFKEWADFLKDEKNHLGREYTYDMITRYAREKRHGFSYKEYPDMPGEVWKEITDSANTSGRWEISNTNRVKYITKYAENVLSGERLGLSNGYPAIMINGKHLLCHIIAFQVFFPEEYAARNPGEIILHEDDDKLDFRPHKLRLGTQSENAKDARNNGKHDGTKTAQMRCVSYLEGIFEKDHCSQADAVIYLKTKGYDKADSSGIRKALGEKRKTAYGRTWKLST